MTTVPLTVNDSKEALLARIAQLEAAKSNKDSVIKLTVAHPADPAKNVKESVGGSLSMYCVGRYPITLTFTQWLVVAKQLPLLLTFAAANFAKLYFKSDEQREAAETTITK